MDANQDEATRCMDKARQSLKRGDLEQAERMALKANRMFPTSDVDSFLRCVATRKSDSKDANDEENKNSPKRSETFQPPGDDRSTDGPRARSNVPENTGSNESSRNAARSSPATSAKSTGKPYTLEQKQLIEKVIRTKNYYEVLGLEKTAGEDEVKKTYRKLALILHPDKCKHPKAEEAFKIISMATQTLTDVQKRAEYDSGRLNTNNSYVHQRRSHQEFMTPQDLFEAVFGQNFNHPNHYHHPRRPVQRTRAGTEGHPPQPAHHVRQTGAFFSYMQVLSFVFLVLFSIFASYMTEPNTPHFKFQPDSKYSVHRTTGPSSVPFFVSPQVNREYPTGTDQQKRLDNFVEFDHFQRECELDRRRYFAELEEVNSLPRKKREERRRMIQNNHSSYFPNCQKLRSIEQAQRHFKGFTPFNVMW